MDTKFLNYVLLVGPSAAAVTIVCLACLLKEEADAGAGVATFGTAKASHCDKIRYKNP